ncbi:hypothetical protein HK102_002011, partial [Quaeritorhiza haematococci]
MIQPSYSLVKYDNPVLVSRTTDLTKSVVGKAGGLYNAGNSGGAGAGMPNMTDGRKPPTMPPKKLPPVDDKGRAKTPTQTEDILNSILPP